MANNQANTPSDAGEMFGQAMKRRKIDEQKVGDYIVQALKAVHMRLMTDGSEIQTGKINDQENYFSPRFLHWLFGEKE